MPVGTTTIELLLIEDDPIAANLFLERIRHFAPGEFNVTQARSLKAGLEEAADFDFALAVLDLTLPDSVGIETCSAFSSAQPNVPYIVLTGVSDNSLTETLSLAGAKAALVKEDCRGEHLVDAVRAAAKSRPYETVEASKAVTEARFRNAIIDSADGIVVIDKSGEIILVSAGAESLLGRPAADLTGSSLGIDLNPGTPVRAQMVREEPGHAMSHSAGVVRQFDVCKLHVNEVEFWPFSHQWANRPVTVCAMRDVTNQTAEESRQRSIVRIDEPLQVSSGIDAVCADIAVRLGALVKFNRFEASLWRPDLHRLQLMAELGLRSRGREISGLLEKGTVPAEFDSWTMAWSSEGNEPRVAVSIGFVEPGAYTSRDEAVLTRCATMIATALAEMKRSPVLTPADSGPGAGFADLKFPVDRISSLPEAA